MTKAQLNVKEFMVKAGQDCPAKPVVPSKEVRELRARLIMEEALETVRALGFESYLEFVDNNKSNVIDVGLIRFSEEFEPNLVKIADGVGDTLVVSLGCALACGIDMEPIENEISKSNLSKFIDGYRREDGKFMKGPSYSPANIAPIIEEQSK